MKRLARALVLFVVAFIPLSACSASEAPGAGSRLSIASGPTGGVFFVLGGALAEQISTNIEGTEATAETTSASVDNLLLVSDESSDMAFTVADAAADAVRGEGSFEEPLQIQALARLYPSINQVVTLEGSGIESVEDLQGKRVSVGAPGSASEIFGLRLLEAAGIDPDADIDRSGLSVNEAAAALGDGNIDAFTWSAGIPTGAITDVATTNNIRLVPIAAYIDELQSEYGEFYQEGVIPAGTYSGVGEDVPTIVVPNYFVVNEEMDEELAYQITKLIFENKDALVEAHPEAENIKLEEATDVPPLDLHPGAQRYYDEAGE
jgi:uncharacterized protein